jgi:hypothetical protein
MIKVSLKIIQLILHIKEPVVVEIKIRKHQKTIAVPNQFALIDTKSDINASFDFHMTHKDPSFQLCVVLVMNGHKKLAGWVELNLRNLNRQQTVHIEDHLVNCPDKSSLIKF